MTLGVSATWVGVIEGAAESCSILLKGFSGWWSDRMASRKPLVVFGYSLSVLARLSLLVAQVPAVVGAAKIFDRTGMGLRTAPRDAMVADAVKAGMNGRAFGIVRFLDTLGAVTGTIVVLALGVGSGPMDAAMFHKCVLIAMPFSFATVAFLWLGVPKISNATKSKTYLSWRVPKAARGYLVAVGIFALGNSSDAFLVVRAQELGFSFRHSQWSRERDPR